MVGVCCAATMLAERNTARDKDSVFTDASEEDELKARCRS
jgi:hypothetical protein